jgi:hypothetical protein
MAPEFFLDVGFGLPALPEKVAHHPPGHAKAAAQASHVVQKGIDPRPELGKAALDIIFSALLKNESPPAAGM